MISLQQIKARLDYANQAIEIGQEQDIPIKMLVCDVLDLLDLLQPRSPDKPPDTERDVLCLVGYKFPGAELRWRVSRFVGYWDVVTGMFMLGTSYRLGLIPKNE